MLIEDDPVYGQALADRLAPFCDVDAVGTLAAGINCALGRSYWCILLDLSLPDSRWPDTFKTFSQITKAASIVIVSGQDSPDFVGQTIRQGAAGYIVKGRDDRDGEMIFNALNRAVLHQQTVLGLDKAAAIAHDTAQFNRPNNNNQHAP